jgi:hypothetical protein
LRRCIPSPRLGRLDIVVRSGTLIWIPAQTEQMARTTIFETFNQVLSLYKRSGNALSYKPKKTKATFLRVLVLLPAIVAALLVAERTAGLEKRPESQPQSIADIQSLSFDDREFVLKFKAENQSVPLFEYFLANESPSEWTELVDFRIEPKVPHANKPLDHAVRTARLFKATYPLMPFAIYKNDKTGEALLDFLIPLSDKDGLEFNAFRFYAVGPDHRVLCFHYAKKLKGPSETKKYQDAKAEIVALRQKILLIIWQVPLYRP